MFYLKLACERKLKLGITALLVLFFIAGGRSVAAQEVETGVLPEEIQGISIDGWMDGRFRLRSDSATSARDVDFILATYFDLGTPSRDGRLVLDGVLFADLDGKSAGSDPFFSLGDTWDKSIEGFVYNAYIDWNSLKLGRQEVHRADALYFDGLRYSHQLSDDTNLTLFGGTPVHFYDESNEDDRLAGLGLDWRLGPKFRIAIDEVWIRDSLLRFNGTDGIAEDLISVVSATWLADQNNMWRGSASMVGDRSRRQEVSGQWFMPSNNSWARFQIRHQNDYGEFVSSDISPFMAVIGDVAPYWDLNMEYSRQFENLLECGVGFQGRMLENDADIGINNREFNRWFVSLSKDDLIFDDSSCGVRADLWDTDNNSLVAGSAWLKLKYANKREISLGTDFSKYRFDVFTGREYLDDRQFWVKAKLPITEDTRMRVRYARDRSQFGTDHLFEVAWSMEF